MPEYYLRVSVQPTPTTKQQIHLFKTYDKDVACADVLMYMIEMVLQEQKLKDIDVTVEQFNKM